MVSRYTHSKLGRKIKWLGAFIAGLIFVLAVHTVNTPVGTVAANERVITVYYDGIEQTVVTDAQTVGEVLDRAGIALHSYDAVEPKTDTELTAPSYDINVYRARPVTVVDGFERYTVMTPHTSAREIVQSAGFELYAEDEYSLSRIDDIVLEGGVGLKLTIDRATAISLMMYGIKAEIRTQADTVGELLKEKNIVLGPEDGTNMALDAPLMSGVQVEVWRNGVQTVTQEQEIAFPIKQIRDTSKPAGYKQVQTAGVKGKKLVTYQVELRDGHEVSRTEIQNVIVEQPKEQTEIIGVQTGFAGPIQDAFARLRQCESGGNYANKNNPKYRGAYQFSYSTWANFGGYYDPADAPAEIQDQAAYNLYKRRGWQPWPACSQKLGLQDIYR